MKLKDLVNKEMEVRYRLLLVCSDEKYFNYEHLIRSYINYDFLNLHVAEIISGLGYTDFGTLEGLEITLLNSKYIPYFLKDNNLWGFDLYQILSPHCISSQYKYIFASIRKANSIAILNILYEAKKGLEKKKLNNKFGLMRREETDMKNDKDLIVYKSEEEMAKEFIESSKRFYGYLSPTNYAAISMISINQEKPRLDLGIKNVIFNDPATIILWNDGTKTVVKVQDGDRFDPEKGLTMAIVKKLLGNQGNYYNELKKWLPKEEKVEFGGVSIEDAANVLANFTEAAFKALNGNEVKDKKKGA